MHSFNFARRSIPLLTLLLLVTTSCARRAPTAPDSARSASATSATARHAAPTAAAAAQTTFEGEVGPGAHYVISVPDTWNGDLVVYLHGYTAPVFPVGLPPGEEPLVEGLRAIALQGGFAFAYSTYSQTGLGLKDAAQRSDQLRNVFTSLVAQPNRTFLIGASFGALAAIKLVEDHPNRYAGLLTLCGMVGGVRAEIDYAANVRVLFDCLYPGVLRGSLYELPPDFDIKRDIQDAVAAAITANPQPALELARITQTPVPFSTGEELVRSIIQALVLQAVELEDLLDRTHGQGFFDNSQTIYAGDLSPERLAYINGCVARYTAGPAAIQFLEKYYQPSGDLRIPVVSMHTSLDPVVPIFHEDLYEALVAQKGQSANFHRVTVDRYGHLMFQPSELVAGFGEMIAGANVP